MKKIYYLAIGLCVMAFSTPAFSQETAETNEAQEELRSYMNEGLVKFKSDNEKFQFRVGGRITVDGAHYIDDYTDRSSGAKFSSARLRIISKLGEKLDVKLDLDFASKSVLKDAYLRWHTTNNSFLRIGNYAQPFSAENIQSTMDYPFVNKSATIEALGTGRAVGVSYRYYHKYFWVEGGVFSQKFSTDVKDGDMGYSVSARLLGRIQGDNWGIHAGGSFLFSRPDANGFTNGSDDYNRQVTLSAKAESAVDNHDMMTATVNNVKNGWKAGGEIMAHYDKVYLKGEYIHARYNRERDWDYNFTESLGTIMSTFFPTMESFKMLWGEDIPANFSGYTVEAGVMAIGKSYRYNNVDALMNRPKGKSLEIVARYNHTNLNDIEDGSIFYYEGFYSGMMFASFGVTNQSISAGKIDTFTLGVNYYITNNIIARLNYSYQKLDNKYNKDYRLDKNLHSIQARIAFEF